MSGVEIAGLVLGVVPILQNTLILYSQLIEGIRFARDINKRRDIELLYTRLTLERARFETSIQQLSKFDSSSVSPDFSGLLIELLERNGKLLLDAEEVVRRDEPFSGLTKRFMWSRKEKTVLELLDRLCSTNDALSMAGHVLATANKAPQGESSTLWPGISVAEHLRSFLSDTSDQDGHGLEDQGMLEDDDDLSPGPSSDAGFHNGEPVTSGNLMRNLVLCCNALFTQMAQRDAAFVDVMMTYRLWKHGMDSRHLYQSIDTGVGKRSKSAQHDLGELLLSTMIRLCLVLSWWAKQEPWLATHLWNDIISDATSAIKDVYRAIPTFPPTDIDDLTRAAAKASARAKSFKPTILRTANLIVETLRDSIMVVLDRSRTHRARTSENMTASEVTRLLDASVDLIAPASEAVSKAACSTRVAGKDTAQTNSLAVESVQRVFEEQAAQLKKWKTKHREAIALKLADKNPAKMAAIAEALETIVQVLDELSRVGQRRSRETGVDEWLLGSIMKSFETSVQSLVTIEGQMELIETPPSYADIAKDRVILSIDGAIEGSRLTVAS